MFNIADVPFTGVSDEEKRVYAAAIKETGSYRGYKFPGYFVSYTVRSAVGVIHLRVAYRQRGLRSD